MRILIADDDPLQRELLEGFLRKQGHQVFAAADGNEALAILRRECVQLALVDQRMPGLAGEAVIAALKAINPLTRGIMITAYGSVETAVAVMKLGADDFLEKPVDLSRLLAKIQEIDQSLAVAEDVEAIVRAGEAAALPVDIIGSSLAMQETLSLVRRIADSPWSVLIQGETGTGKELIARLIHRLADVPNAPFVEVNCAAIPETLFESELFGHEKGAFTGADRRRRGRFELAQGGSLFLDEVGELPAPLQSKLLRALQEKRIHRVGGEQDIPVEVRIIAATNKDLRTMVDAGVFREDLFFRLKVLDIVLPPLRHRREDIPALVDHFVSRYAPRPMRVAPETLDLLVRYRYPGNVRELEHILQRSLTLARGSLLQPGDLPAELRQMEGIEPGLLQERLDALEREMLQTALDDADGVQTRAAERLGISERVLRYKLGKHGLRRREP